MSKIFRGQTATLTIDGVTVGVLQDAEIGVEFNDEELRGQSLKRADIQRTQVSITVSASYGNFDLAGIKSLIGYDDSNNEIEDTPAPPSFSVTGNFVSTDGNEDFDVEVTEVIFNDINWSWSPDEHVIQDLTGTGTDITITDNSV